jgi:hypothetical protein
MAKAAVAILWPRGTRSRAAIPAIMEPGAIWSTATTTLSSGERRKLRGVVMSRGLSVGQPMGLPRFWAAAVSVSAIKTSSKRHENRFAALQ